LTNIEGIGPETGGTQSETLIAAGSRPAVTHVAEEFKEHVQHFVNDDRGAKVEGG